MVQTKQTSVISMKSAFIGLKINQTVTGGNGHLHYASLTLKVKPCFTGNTFFIFLGFVKTFSYWSLHYTLTLLLSSNLPLRSNCCSKVLPDKTVVWNATPRFHLLSGDKQQRAGTIKGQALNEGTFRKAAATDLHKGLSPLQCFYKIPFVAWKQARNYSVPWTPPPFGICTSE